MSNALLHRLTPESDAYPDQPVTIYWQGQAIKAQADDSIASALLAAGIRSNRKSQVSGQPRAAFCMMGSCFECLVSLDGRIVQACMEPVADQMQLSSPPREEVL